MNAIIGAGPFGAPTTLVNNNGIITICMYVFVLAAVWALSYSIARVAYLYPQPGSFYAYTYPWGGAGIAWISVLLYLISLFTAMGALTHIASQHITNFVPIDPMATGYWLLAILLLMHVFYLRFSQITQLVLLGGTVSLLIMTIVVCLMNADIRLIDMPQDFSWYDIITPSYSVLFGFLGFETATGLHTIVASPRRVVPRAITYSVLLTGALYLLYVVGLVMAVPREAFAQRPILLASLLHHISPHTWLLTYVVHAALLFAIVGTLHATSWAAGVLIRTLIPYHPTWGIVWQDLSVLVSISAIACAYMAPYTLDTALRVTVMTRGITYLLSLITLLLIPAQWRQHYNYVAIAALCGIITLLYAAIT